VGGSRLEIAERKVRSVPAAARSSLEVSIWRQLVTGNTSRSSKSQARDERQRFKMIWPREMNKSDFARSRLVDGANEELFAASPRRHSFVSYATNLRVVGATRSNRRHTERDCSFLLIKLAQCLQTARPLGPRLKRPIGADHHEFLAKALASRATHTHTHTQATR
jgi:hypothetical protein